MLRRRPVRGTVRLTDVVGKEGTKIDAGPLALVLDPEDLTSTFLEGDEWYSLVLPVLVAAGRERVSEESAVPLGTVRHLLRGRTPSPKHRRMLLLAADRIASVDLVSVGCRVPQTETGRLSAWLSSRFEQRTCDGCGQPLVGRQRRWCAKCRQRGHRTAALPDA